MYRVEGNESNSDNRSKMALLFFRTLRRIKTVPLGQVLGREKDGLLKVIAKQLKLYIQFAGLFQGTDIVISWGVLKSSRPKINH